LALPGESPRRAAALVRSCADTLSIAGRFGQELAGGLALLVQRESRLQAFEDAVARKAITATEDPAAYPETEEIAALELRRREALDIERAYGQMDWTKAVYDAANLAGSFRILEGVLTNVKEPEGRPNPAKAALSALDTRRRRLAVDAVDADEEYANAVQGKLLNELGRVAGMHAKYIAALIRVLKRRRRERVEQAREDALIPTVDQMKRIDRYRSDNERSLLRRLEIAAKLREFAPKSD
jgi:hypothetical protein